MAPFRTQVLAFIDAYATGLAGYVTIASRIVQACGGSEVDQARKTLADIGPSIDEFLTKAKQTAEAAVKARGA